jgi:hypothetical protein
MIVLRWINAVRRVGDGIRYRITSSAIMLLGAMFIFFAAALATGASYLWLETILPNYLAALCVAGGLVLIGGLVIAIAHIRRRRYCRSIESSPFADAPRQSETVADRAIQTLLSEMTNSPSSTLLTALTLGVVIGLLRPNDSP